MPELQQPAGRISQIISLTILGVAVLLLAGWQLDINLFKTVIPHGTIPMKASAAICFVLAGTALHLLARKVRTGKDKIEPLASGIFRVACILLIAIGLLTLGEDRFGWNLGIDQLFQNQVPDQINTDQINTVVFYPGRMGLQTALNFVLVGVALLLLNRRQSQTIWIGQLLTVAILMIALQRLIGCIYGVPDFYQTSANSTLVVLNTAVIWILLASRILFLYPAQGLMQALTTQLEGGTMARQLLPSTLGLPFFLGWLILQGYRAGYYDAGFALALLVILLMTLQTGLVWQAAHRSNCNTLKRQQGEAIRQQTEADLRASERLHGLAGEDELHGPGDEIDHRKQIEPNLYGEAQFRRLFDSNIIGAVFADLSGMITEANDAFLTMVGYTRAELLAGELHWPAMTPPEYQPQDQQSVAELKQRGACVPYEKEYFRKDGKRVSVLVGSALLPDSQQQAICFVLDLSARKQAELAMRHSEERYRSLVSAMTSIVWISNAEGAFVESQPAWAAYTGQTWEDYQGFGWLQAIHPEDQDRVLALWVRSREQRLIYQAEGRIWYEARGEYRHFEARGMPLVNADGTVREWVGTITDVHDRKQAEAAVIESEARFRHMTDTAPVLVWMSGVDKLCNYFNQGWLNFTGRTMQQEMGYGWTAGVHPDDLWRCLETYTDAFDRHQPFEMEYRLRRFDGAYRWILDVGVPRFTTEGCFLGYIGSCMDIHDRKQAEANIQQLNEILEARVKERTAQLEAANQELESFSYSVSHDLRAPLRHIAGFVDLLQKRLDPIGLDATSQRYLTIITETTHQASVLIDDLLAFSRMGRAEMRLMQVDMNRLVREVQQELEPETLQRKIDWQIEDLPTVQGDPSMLRLVMQNLIENAVKYTRSQVEARIQIGSMRQNQETVFFVRDNGIGFNMQYAQKLFGIFQRLHSDSHYEGSGIGLANVRRIIHRHGGRTWAESTLNEGATFYFSLPKPISITPLENALANETN